MDIVRTRSRQGFTIVELLIVIIVIGILATLVLIAYNNVQETARMTKVKHDLTEFSKAVQLARENTSKTLMQITGNNATMYWCVVKPDGTNLATLPRTDRCWTYYQSALDAISTAAGVGINNMTDPYGRPYYIDENEGEAGYPPCSKDALGEYTIPFKSGYQHQPNTTMTILPFDPACR